MPILRRRFTTGPQVPLLAALACAAIVPAVCITWFMSIAVRNEHLALQERLTESYSNQLVVLKQRTFEWIRARQGRLVASASFAELVESQVADSVVLYDHSGQPLYPDRNYAPDSQA